MYLRKLLALSSVLFSIVVTGAADFGPNLIVDPSFTKLGTLPVSFSVRKENNTVVLCKKRTDPGEYTMVTVPLRKLIPGRLYQFGVRVKTADISAEFTEVCNVEFYDKKKFREAKVLHVGKGSRDWHEISMEFTPGEGPFDSAHIVFFLQRGVSGSVCFSSPFVREIKPDLKRLERENAELDPAALPDALRPELEAMRSRYVERVLSEMPVDAATGVEQYRHVEWNALRQLWKAAGEFEKVRPQVAVAPEFADVILGVATSAEKVLPRAASFRPLPPKVSLSAAQNERESFQLVVFPAGRDLRNVSVTVSDLVSADGKSWRNAFTIMPVGYVEVEPGTGADYVGFYPDPLMMHLNAVKTVKSGDAQSFWFRLAVPRSQAPGLYRGEATVSIDGKTAFRFPVEAQVYGFALPDRAMLPLAITYLLKEKHLKMWTDMLTDYYITPDNLYNLQFRQERADYYGPDFELLAKMKQDGTLNHFNLGYVDEALDDPKDNHGMKFQIDRIRPRYEKAKEFGLLDYAYIYGCDESSNLVNTDLTAKILKKEFPDVPLFTSAYDRGHGTTGQLPSWDWYCPLIPVYENTPSAVAEARRQGKQVWWYICCGPLKPYPNIFVDSPQIEIRLLMGAMTAKYRPDGFLYYETTNWRKHGNPQSLGEEVFTDWNPNSFGHVNGDGYWFYRGPDDIPLPSIRVEGFRDGLEDYAYHEILRGKVEAAKVAGRNSAWLTEAEEALRIPESLVKSLSEHTTDPFELLAWRQHMAELIEQAE